MQNNGVARQHYAADAAYGHQKEKGNDRNFGCVHDLLLIYADKYNVKRSC